MFSLLSFDENEVVDLTEEFESAREAAIAAANKADSRIKSSPHLSASKVASTTATDASASSKSPNLLSSKDKNNINFYNLSSQKSHDYSSLESGLSATQSLRQRLNALKQKRYESGNSNQHMAD
jgi:hypothetical protein